MVCGSLFSGIGGMDLGLARAGFRHEFFCEQDAYRRRVLGRHWPGVPVYEDIRHIATGEAAGQSEDAESRRRGQRGAPRPVAGDTGDGRIVDAPGGGAAIDLLCGGFPCQDLSVAGRRAGLAGERSGLFFEFARVADLMVRPGGWVVVENVPGLLSSNNGRDFAIVLATLAELGFHDLAWRVLDSRYFGVPQRRRRVFVVGRRACGGCARQVLLEPEGGGGDFEAGREARTRAAGGAAVSTLQASGGHGTARRSYQVDAEGAAGGHLVSLGAPADPDGVRAAPGAAGRVDDPDGRVVGSLNGSVRGSSGMSAEAAADGWLVTDRQRGGVICPFDPKPDGPRYAGCGDAVTASVAEWIGRRIIQKGGYEA